MKKERTRAIKKASIVGIVGNAALSVMKITTGIITGSMSVLADGIDSSADILTSLITLISAGIASKPPDKVHAYGHSRAETLSTKLLAFFLFFAGAQLALDGIKNLFDHQSRGIPARAAIYVTIISIFGKIALAVYKTRIGKKINSKMLIADGKNMTGDVIISSTVLVGLLLTTLLKLPILDVIFALLVSLWIMKIAYGIFVESNNELMDGIEDKTLYKSIFDTLKTIPQISNPHKVRIRKMNNDYLIDLDIEVDPDMSVKEAHDISISIKKCLIKRHKDIYDVMIHIEPIGNEESEPYGLCSADVSDD